MQIETTKSRVLVIIEATLQLSNLDLVASYVFKAEKSGKMPVTTRFQNDLIGPALSDAQVSNWFRAKCNFSVCVRYSSMNLVLQSWNRSVHVRIMPMLLKSQNA